MHTTPQQQPITPNQTPRSTSPSNIKLQPFFTYNSNSQQLQLHQCEYMDLIGEACFVSLVQVKTRDLRIFGVQGQVGGDHGVYVSVPMRVNEELEIKKCRYICYLVLLTNQTKIPQKFQDLFSAITLTLSTTCVFDISSKYLRQSKNSENRPQRNNYVIMNTYNSKIGEIYKASVVTVPQSQNSKMEISTKMVQERSAIFEEFAKNRGRGYSLRGILNSLKSLTQQYLLLKSYLNFEEFQIQFLAELRLNQFISENSAEFSQLKTKQQMLSINQLKNLQKTIFELDLSEITAQQIPVLNKAKRKLIQELTSFNNKLTQKFLASLKQQFFQNASSLAQISIKKQLSLKILEQYGIDAENISVICYEAEIRLQNEQIKRLINILSEKQQKIENLSTNLGVCKDIIGENSERLKNYQRKFLDFKQINVKYLQICSQLDKQRQQSLQNNEYIQKILTQKQEHIKIEQKLTKLLSQMQENKTIQQTLINALHTDLRNKQHYIYELKSKNQESQKKLKGYNALEDKAWKCIQDAQQARAQLKRYKELLKSLEDHFDAFKRCEFEKFNYILKTNAEVHRKTKKQSQQKSLFIQEQTKKISQLNAQLESQKIRTKYCMQQLNLHSQSINKTTGESENNKSHSEDKSFQNNRSFISVS